MPSHKVHRLIGNVICGFYCSEIDNFIDKKEVHDAGRYDLNIFVNEALMFFRKYGGDGLCYYILHHILDRLVDILISELCHGYTSYKLGRRIEDVYEEVKKYLLMRLRNDLKTVLPVFIQNVKVEVPEYELLHAMTQLVLTGIEFGIDCVILHILSDVNVRGKPTVVNRVLNDILMKEVASKMYHRAIFDKDLKIVEEYTKQVLDSAKQFLIQFFEIVDKKCNEFIKNREEQVNSNLEKVLQVLNKYNAIPKKFRLQR